MVTNKQSLAAKRKSKSYVKPTQTQMKSLLEQRKSAKRRERDEQSTSLSNILEKSRILDTSAVNRTCLDGDQVQAWKRKFDTIVEQKKKWL